MYFHKILQTRSITELKTVKLGWLRHDLRAADALLRQVVRRVALGVRAVLVQPHVLLELRRQRQLPQVVVDGAVLDATLHRVADRHARESFERGARDLALDPLDGLPLEAVVGRHEQVVKHNALVVRLLPEAGCHVALSQTASVVVDLANTVLNDLEEDVQLVAVRVVAMQKQQRCEVEVAVDDGE